MYLEKSKDLGIDKIYHSNVITLKLNYFIDFGLLDIFYSKTLAFYSLCNTDFEYIHTTNIKWSNVQHEREIILKYPKV